MLFVLVMELEFLVKELLWNLLVVLNKREKMIILVFDVVVKVIGLGNVNIVENIQGLVQEVEVLVAEDPEVDPDPSVEEDLIPDQDPCQEVGPTSEIVVEAEDVVVIMIVMIDSIVIMTLVEVLPEILARLDELAVQDPLTVKIRGKKMGMLGQPLDPLNMIEVHHLGVITLPIIGPP